MGMVHTARPYVIFIIVNKSNLVKPLLAVPLLRIVGKDEICASPNAEGAGECVLLAKRH